MTPEIIQARIAERQAELDQLTLAVFKSEIWRRMVEVEGAIKELTALLPEPDTTKPPAEEG